MLHRKLLNERGDPVQMTNRHGCAVIPGRQVDPGGFVRTGRVLNAVDPVIDVSAEGVRELMRALGWPTPEEFAEMVMANQVMADKLALVTAELEDLREFERSAEYTLEHLGQKVRKKPGRKPKEVESAV